MRSPPNSHPVKCNPFYQLGSDFVGLVESGGTRLTWGGVGEGQVLARVGTSVVGVDPPLLPAGAAVGLEVFALSLADSGYPVTLIEKSDFLCGSPAVHEIHRLHGSRQSSGQ